jgi:hypothetical protein
MLFIVIFHIGKLILSNAESLCYDHFPCWKVNINQFIQAIFRGIVMHRNQEESLSREEALLHAAQADLAVLQQAQNQASQMLRPPLWLNLVLSFSVAVVLAAASLQNHGPHWDWIQGVSLIALFISLVIYYLHCKKMGVKQVLWPQRRYGWLVVVVFAALGAGIVTAGSVLAGHGLWFFAYALAATYGVINFVIMDRYSAWLIAPGHWGRNPVVDSQ